MVLSKYKFLNLKFNEWNVSVFLLILLTVLVGQTWLSFLLLPPFSALQLYFSSKFSLQRSFHWPLQAFQQNNTKVRFIYM